MRSNHVVASLGISCSVVALTAAAWTFIQWNASGPLAHAEVLGASTESLPTPPPLLKVPSVDPTLASSVHARQFALYHVESGRTVLAREAEAPVPVASTTKLMTAYVIAKIGNPDEVVTVSKEAASRPAESSLMGLRAGETITVRDLLYGSLLVSGNDAAYALGEYGGGILDPEITAPDEKVARFVEEMNATATGLRMRHTEYKDSIGFDDEGRSSALDLSKLLAKVIEVPMLREMLGTATLTVTGSEGRYRHDLRNSNRLVTDYNYDGAIGGKTGFTYAAGHCLVTAATRDGDTYVAAILNTIAETNEASAVEARKLLDIGFSQVSWR